MPELPEVETNRRGIEPHLVGATILHAHIRNGRLRWPVSDEIYRLSDTPVLSVQRRAKYLLLELPDGWIIIHGDVGKLADTAGSAAGGKARPCRFGDEQRQNSTLYRSSPLWRGYGPKELEGHNVLAHLGPEPLSDEFNGEYLQQKCAKKKTAIKPRLMDNKLVVGVGNIYASESLFAAGIHPDRPASSLDRGVRFAGAGD